MKVKFLYSTPLLVIANGIRYSHDNNYLSDSFFINWDITKCTCVKCGSNKNLFFDKDGYICCNSCGIGYRKEEHIGKKDFDLIKRVGFHMNHSSTLEHSLLVFHVELSTKALLEWTRHRIGVAYTVTSSRYALDSMGLEFEQIGDKKIDELLEKYKQEVSKLLVGSKKKDFDKLAMLLPQSFMYKMQVSFNLRSLIHFLELRTNKSAHITIRKLAIEILDQLKEKEQMYFELLMENKKIKNNYENNKE